MLTKAVVFLFSIMAIFALIIGNVPLDFTETPSYTTPESREIADYFDANNYTYYDDSWSDVMDGVGYANTTIPTDLSDHDFLEVYCNYFFLGSYAAWEAIYMKHATDNGWWKSGHYLDWEFGDLDAEWPEVTTQTIGRNAIEQAWNMSGNNNTIFYGHCEHLVTSLILKPTNSSLNITQAWDAENITAYVSYSINLNGTSLNIFALIGQLMTFQPLNLGLGTVGEAIIGGAVSSFMWALVLIVIYKVTAGLIPWISGGSGD